MTLALVLPQNSAAPGPNGLPPVPALAARVDWDGTGWDSTGFAGLLAMASAQPAIPAIDAVHPLSATWQRGVRADFSGDQTGSCTLTLDNGDDAYTPDRNWCDNPSFETGLAGWGTRAGGFVSAAGASLSQALDAPAGAGSSCGEAALAGAGGDGIAYRLPWRFRAGQAYQLAYSLRSPDGASASVRLGSAAAGDFAADPAAYRDAVMALGPLAYWRLGEASGSVAADETGAYPGTYVGSPTLGAPGALSGDVDTAVQFNGTSQYVTPPPGAIAAFGGATPWTFVAWANHTPDATYRRILETFDGASSYVSLQSQSADMVLSRVTAAGSETIYASQLTAGWHLVAVTFTGAEMALYVDGALRPTHYGLMNPMASTRALVAPTSGQIAATWNGSAAFNGALDEVSIWNRALSAAEIAGLWTAGRRIVPPGWTRRSLSWTPTADRTDVDIALLHSGGTPGTVRIDAVQLNPGPSLNPYIEAPTKGMLIPGREVLVTAAWGPMLAPQFHGWVQRISPDPLARQVAILCHDQSQRLASTSVLPSGGTQRQYRASVLDEFARANANLCANSSMEQDLVGVEASGAAVARVSTDSVDGSWCAQVTATATGQSVSWKAMSPAMTAPGQWYTASLWARLVSGSAAWSLQINTDATNAAIAPVTLTAEWRRYSVSWPAGNAVALSGYPGTPMAVLTSAGAGVALVDAVAITQGAGLLPYLPSGVGRCASLVTGDNSEFEVTPPQPTSWRAPWPNLVANGDFEDGSTRGWTPGASAALSNDGSRSRWGGRSLLQTATGVGSDPSTATVPGTFLAGVRYGVSAWASGDASSATVRFGDAVNHSVFFGDDGAFHRVTGTWTPSADTVDPIISLFAGNTAGQRTWWDGIAVTAYGVHDGLVGFPGGLSGAGAAATQASGGFTGARCMQVACPAGAGSAIALDMTGSGPYFWAGRPYTVSFWHKLVSGSTDWRAAIGVGGIDEAHLDFTPGPVWRRAVLTWRPRYSWSAQSGASGVMTDVALAIGTPSGTGPGTILVDALRIDPGGAAQDQEMAFWDLDLAETAAAGSGSYGAAAAALSALNSAVLSAQAILPSSDPPCWRYRSRARTTVDAQAVDEAIAEDVTAVSGLEVDEAAVVNSQAVWSAASVYGPVNASDDISAQAFGPAPGSTINATRFVATQAEAQAIADAVIARYRRGVMRPRMTVVNRFPSQLSRDVGDLLSVTLARGRLFGAHFRILAVQTTVGEAGQRWETAYTLEEVAG